MKGQVVAMSSTYGEVMKCCTHDRPDVALPIPGDGVTLNPGDVDEHGSSRPFIVYFGEPVPMMGEAIRVTVLDILLIVGTSLNVYPAAGLVHCVPWDTHLPH